MSWLRRWRGEAPPAPVTVPPPPPPPPAEIEHGAPGLRRALERLAKGGGSVLDLGPALAENVAFFNGLHARIRILDLEATLAEEGLWESSLPLPAWSQRAAAALAIDAEERFELVLAWDLLHYLGGERWSAVVAVLGRHVAPGGVIHLLARTGKEMPARPGRFRIPAADLLRESPATGAFAPVPRFSHGEIEKLARGFASTVSYLDKHGLQELLLEHAEELHLPPRAEAQPRPQRRR
ncbi:MAG: class I SAM-dependent methyltransferase [Thermoanaerobaculia bacterium]